VLLSSEIKTILAPYSSQSYNFISTVQGDDENDSETMKQAVNSVRILSDQILKL
jgi:hypothetical protein